MCSVVGGREGKGKRERERASLPSPCPPSSIGLYRFSASDIVYAHDPAIGQRACIYIYIFLGAKTEPFFSVGVRKKKKGEKGSSWKIIIPPLDSGDHAAVYRR